MHRRPADVSIATDIASVFDIVLNIDQRLRKMGGSGMFSFDSNLTRIVCGNSANVSICNTQSMFVGEIRQIHNTKVATIGSKGHPDSSIVTVRWHWKDADGIGYEFLVEDVLYFPQLPINILSIISFACQLKDKDGIEITTLQTQSRLYWDKNKFSRTI